MRRINKILFLVVVILSLFIVTSCSDEVDYSSLTAPNVKKDELTNLFYWDAIDGVEGYVISIDGEVKGIGNPVIERNEVITDSMGAVSTITNYVCEYNLDVSSLNEGIHEVKFASFVQKQLSPWSKVFEVSTATRVLKTPTLQINGNEFSVTSNYLSFEFDFGEGIKASYVTEENQGLVKIDFSELKFLPLEITNESGEQEEVIPTLEVGKTYFVSVIAKTFSLESQPSNIVEFIYTEQEKLPTPKISGEHNIDVSKNFTSNDFIEAYAKDGYLNIKINDKIFKNVKYSADDYKIDIINLVNGLLKDDNNIDVVSIKKDILDGKLSVEVQFCGFNNYLNSEWSSKINYKFVNLEEYVKDNIVLTINNYGAKINILEYAKLNYDVKVNNKTIQGIENDNFITYNFLSNLNYDNEMNIVKINISGSIFGGFVEYEIEPYEIIVSDIDDLFISIINDQVIVSEDNLSVNINAENLDEYSFLYSVYLNDNFVNGYNVPGAIDKGLRYDFLNSGFLVIGENKVVIDVVVKYNDEVVYDITFLTTTIMIDDPNTFIYEAFNQELLESEIKLNILEKYIPYLQNLNIELSLNDKLVSCEKVSKREYSYVFNVAKELVIGKNNFNFTVKGNYMGFAFTVNLDKLVKEVNESEIDRFVNSLLEVEFNTRDNIISLNELQDYEYSITTKHLVNNYIYYLNANEKNEIIVPITFGKNQVIVYINIFCFGEQREIELMNKSIYVQEYVSNVKINGSLLSWDYDSKDAFNEILYYLEIYNRDTDKLIYSYETYNNRFDFNDFYLDSNKFTINIYVLVNEEMSEAVDYYFERENNYTSVNFRNNNLEIYNYNDNYCYEVIADGESVYSSSNTTGEVELYVGNYDYIEVVTKQLGDNIFYLDTNYEEYKISIVDSLSYNIIDGSKLVVNGYGSIYNLIIECEETTYSYTGESYYEDSGTSAKEDDYFRILDFIDSNNLNDFNVYEQKYLLEGMSIVSRTLEVDLSNRLETALSLEITGSKANIINQERLAKFEYKIILKNENNLYDGLSIYDYNQSDKIELSDLESGVYSILVRQKGQGNKLSSKWVVTDFISFKDLSINYQLNQTDNFDKTYITVYDLENIDVMNCLSYSVKINNYSLRNDEFDRYTYYFNNVSISNLYDLSIDVNFNSKYLYIDDDKPSVNLDLKRYKYEYKNEEYNKDIFLLDSDDDTILPTAKREIYENTLFDVNISTYGVTTTYKSVDDMEAGYYKVTIVKEDDFSNESLFVKDIDILGDKKEEIYYIIMKYDSKILENLGLLDLPKPFVYNIKNDVDEYIEITESDLVNKNFDIYIKGYYL